MGIFKRKPKGEINRLMVKYVKASRAKVATLEGDLPRIMLTLISTEGDEFELELEIEVAAQAIEHLSTAYTAAIPTLKVPRPFF